VHFLLTTLLQLYFIIITLHYYFILALARSQP
jgi:hypothetical protein